MTRTADGHVTRVRGRDQLDLDQHPRVDQRGDADHRGGRPDVAEHLAVRAADLVGSARDVDDVHPGAARRRRGRTRPRSSDAQPRCRSAVHGLRVRRRRSPTSSPSTVRRCTRPIQARSPTATTRRVADSSSHGPPLPSRCPLTTAPASRRHRRDRERLGQGERPGVERLADDRALDADAAPAPAIARRSSSEETPPEATTGRSVRAQTSRSRSRFGPAQGAVLGDVGDDVAGAAVARPAGPAPRTGRRRPGSSRARPASCRARRGRPRPGRRARRSPARTSPGPPARRCRG